MFGAQHQYDIKKKSLQTCWSSLFAVLHLQLLPLRNSNKRMRLIYAQQAQLIEPFFFLIVWPLLNPESSKLTSRSEPAQPVPTCPPHHRNVRTSLHNEVRAGRAAVGRIGAFQRRRGSGHSEIDHLRMCHSWLYQI